MVIIQLSSEASWYNNFANHVMAEYNRLDSNLSFYDIRNAILKQYRATYHHSHYFGWLSFQNDEFMSLFILRFS